MNYPIITKESITLSIAQFDELQNEHKALREACDARDKIISTYQMQQPSPQLSNVFMRSPTVPLVSSNTEPLVIENDTLRRENQELRSKLQKIEEKHQRELAIVTRQLFEKFEAGKREYLKTIKE